MAASLPNFDAGVLPLGQIRVEARRHLVDILDSRRGKKILVLDPKISGFLGLLAEVTLFREHGVDQLQHLTGDPLGTADARAVIFLVRSRIENAQLVAQHVKDCIGRGGQLPEFAVYFIPRRTIACEKVFQERGIASDVSIGEFPLDFIPFDCDVLSLELDAAFREVVIEGDWSSSFYMARGLMQLQRMFGPIPVIKGKGRAAEDVANMLERMTDAADASFPGSSGIDELVLIDREVDCVTPMCTQLTYEGLLDEVLGIKNGSVTLDQAGAAKQRIVLNSADATYGQIRDWHVGSVGVWLNEQAKSFHTGYKGTKAAELKELKEFTTKLKSLPQIQRHIELLSAVQAVSGRPAFRERVCMEQALLDAAAGDAAAAFIEDMMCNEERVETVLRMMCLLSLTQAGLSKRNFDGLRRELLHTYGHQHLLTLQALQTAGLLKLAKGGKPPFALLSRALKLMVDDWDPKDPADPAYVFSGYAPISIRLVEAALRNPPWSGVPDEALKLLPGPHFTRKRARFASHASGASGGRRKTVVVAFVGGATFAEVSALRFLQTRPEVNADFLVATSKLINGNSLLQSLQEDAVLQASSQALL